MTPELGLQVYPNALNARLMIAYSLPSDSEIDLAIYDASGKLVRKLVSNDRKEAGIHALLWDGTDDWGMQVAGDVRLSLQASGRAVTLTI